MTNIIPFIIQAHRHADARPTEALTDTADYAMLSQQAVSAGGDFSGNATVVYPSGLFQ